MTPHTVAAWMLPIKMDHSVDTPALAETAGETMSDREASHARVGNAHRAPTGGAPVIDGGAATDSRPRRRPRAE